MGRRADVEIEMVDLADLDAPFNPMARSIYRSSIASVTAVFLCTCALLPRRVHAQDGPVYVGGSFLVSTTTAASDPPGPGYLRPNFHASMESPVAGLGINGGAFVTRHWDVRGELSFRRAGRGTVTEDERTGHVSSRQLSAGYESAERQFSIFAGRRIAVGPKVDVHPVGGFSLLRGRHELTDRHGTYTIENRTGPLDAPDVSVQRTRYGVGGGADVVIGTSSPVTFVAGVRLTWFHQSSTKSYYDVTVPPLRPHVLNFAAGVRWRPGR